MTLGINNIFSNLNLNSFHIYLFSSIFVLILIILKIVLHKKIDFIGILSFLIISTCALIFSQENICSVINIIFAVLYGLLFIYVLLDYIYTAKCHSICKTRIQDYLKNSEFEYFIQVNKKNRVIDYSLNFTNLANRDNEGIFNLKFPEIFFERTNITAVNGEPATIHSLPIFRSNYSKAISRHKNYEFSITILDENDHEVNYEGIIQPVYFHNILIAKNIYLSVNRMQILETTRSTLVEATQNLLDARNQTYVLMSLTSGVVMYFDFQTKMYMSTESFQKYTDTVRQEYDFDEFLSMIHPEDVQFYMDQSSTINSLRTTRWIFRMFIGNKYYGVIEDSIFLAKDEKLVSLIRVAGDAYKEEASDVVLSTQEANDILDDLGLSDIDKMAGSTIDLLNRLSKKND